MKQLFACGLMLCATTVAQAYVGLENGLGLWATQIDNGGGNDGYLDLAGSVTTDFTVSFDGRLGGQQMFLSLDSGSILQHPMGGDNAPLGLGIETWPSLEYDSFLTMGGWTADASSPVLNIDGAVNIPGAPSTGGAQPFGSTAISRAFAPAPGTAVYDQTDYSLARLTLSGDAFGKLYHFGSWGDWHNALWEFDVVAGAVSEPTLIDFNRPNPRPLPTPPVPEPVAPPTVAPPTVEPPVVAPAVPPYTPPVSSPPTPTPPAPEPIAPPAIDPPAIEAPVPPYTPPVSSPPTPVVPPVTVSPPVVDPSPTPALPPVVAPTVPIDPPVVVAPEPPALPPAPVNPYAPGIYDRSPVSQAPPVVGDSIFFEVNEYPTPGYEGLTTYDISLGLLGAVLNESSTSVKGSIHQHYTHEGALRPHNTRDWEESERLADTQVIPLWSLATGESDAEYSMYLSPFHGPVQDKSLEEIGADIDLNALIRVVTDDPSNVRLTGAARIDERAYRELYGDSLPFSMRTTQEFDLLLSDIGQFTSAVAPFFEANRPPAPQPPSTPPADPSAIDPPVEETPVIDPIVAPPLPTPPVPEPVVPEPVVPPVEDPPVFDPPAPTPPAADPVVPEPTTDPIVVDPEPEPIDTVITSPGESSIGHVWIPLENWDPYYMIASPVVCDCYFEIDTDVDLSLLRISQPHHIDIEAPVYTMAYDGVTRSAPIAFDAVAFTALPAIPEPCSLGLLIGATLAWRGRRQPREGW